MPLADAQPKPEPRFFMDQRHPVTGRPILRNPDGSISTEETITVEYGGKWFNIPTIVGGRRVSDDEAFDLMMQGRNRPVGMFESLDDAVSAARRRSEGLGRGFSNGGSVDDRHKKNAAIEWLRELVSQIPESPNTLSILNMLRAGSNTALNWLDATNRALQGYDPRGALEPADMLAPLGLSAAGAPFAVRGAVGSAGGRLSAAQPGIRAYHGSPYDFDRFDMSKIGTGEGAQAYGHGLYFAEAEDVARSYRDALQHKAPAKVEGVEGGARYLLQNATQEARKYPKADRERVFREWLDETEQMASGKFAPPGMAENVAEAKRLLASGEFVPDLSDAGRMYEVNIRANPDEFLDWDLPLSQQSEKVKEAVRKLWKVPEDRRGESIIMDIGLAYGRDRPAREAYQVASEKLREAGIPGIKYLDQGSRAAGEGTRNYVLFRDDIIDIIRKYGIAAAISTYGFEAVQGALGGQDARNTQRPIAPLGAPQF